MNSESKAFNELILDICRMNSYKIFRVKIIENRKYICIQIDFNCCISNNNKLKIFEEKIMETCGNKCINRFISIAAKCYSGKGQLNAKFSFDYKR